MLESLGRFVQGMFGIEDAGSRKGLGCIVLGLFLAVALVFGLIALSIVADILGGLGAPSLPQGEFDD